jgi:hypothetical protein
MFSSKIRALVHQQWAGLIALFLVLTGGTALATHPGGQNTINSADIIDGQVKVADVGEAAVASHELKNDSILPGDVAPNSLTSGQIANGQVKAADIGDGEVKAAEVATGAVNAAEVATGAARTEEIANGQVQAEDLAPGVAPGASGARAWGTVDANGTLLRKKNVTAVTDPSEGIFCIDPGSGIDPTTAVMVVGNDFSFGITSTGNNDVSVAEWASIVSANCPAGTMEVRTFQGDGSPPSFGETDFGGFDLFPLSMGFTFVIP